MTKPRSPVAFTLAFRRAVTNWLGPVQFEILEPRQRRHLPTPRYDNRYWPATNPAAGERPQGFQRNRGPRNSRRFHRPTHTGKKRDRGRQDDYSNAESASICRDRPPAFHRGRRNSRCDIVPRKCVGSQIQLGYIANLRTSGTHHLNSARFNCRKKDEYCDQRATCTTAGIWGFRNATASAGPVRHHHGAGGWDGKWSAAFG